MKFNKKTRARIGLISSLIICIYGVYGLVTKDSISNLSFIPIILAAGGFIGFIGGIVEIRKMEK
ncbi:hypothetical protein F3157_05010 [Virgibacillus dakarensis]|uniref:Uncharacterized protein n=1 Tax=Lentibacillus populi TaxID=1827502 RepID=A0A9W5X4R0_9BACI|nr:MULTISPECIES: hypothetical protein [Bacillaceae]MBT2214340.1 hypothetical protein [Virgibacillus dakarensis]MTW85017.1 hypothetical protein [Virgibacillus dakarensis]GGB34097.1 hypothetical protein GCM10011409_09420 [Lentibacillus populi]